MHIPCKVGDDLFESVFIADNHTAIIDDVPMGLFPALLNRSRKGPSSNLSAIQVRHQLDISTPGRTHLVNGTVQMGLKLQPTRISIKSQRCKERFHDLVKNIGLEVKQNESREQKHGRGQYLVETLKFAAIHAMAVASN